MKAILALVLVCLSGTAMAQHHGHRHFGHHHHRHWHPHYGWVVPALVGGAVVYAASSRPAPVVVQQPTVVLQPNQVVIDGVVYTKQVMIINGVETEVLVKTN